MILMNSILQQNVTIGDELKLFITVKYSWPWVNVNLHVLILKLDAVHAGEFFSNSNVSFWKTEDFHA